MARQRRSRQGHSRRGPVDGIGLMTRAKPAKAWRGNGLPSPAERPKWEGMVHPAKSGPPSASRSHANVMPDGLRALVERADSAGRQMPPVDLWDPPSCGAIDIRI